jgi:hypothetical protein
MALTSAEKQRRYRERHLGAQGFKERIQLFVTVQTKAQLGRLARHFGYTITKVVEDLVKDAERAILDRLPTRQHRAYLDSYKQRASEHSKVKSAKKPTGSRLRRRGVRLPCNHSHKNSSSNPSLNRGSSTSISARPRTWTASSTGTASQPGRFRVCARGLELRTLPRSLVAHGW